MSAYLAASSGVPLETQRIFTPLGIRFWDFVQDRPIDAGLQVSAQALVPGIKPVAAMRTLSGVYAMRGLSGLHDVEYPQEPLDGSTSPPRLIPFVITVADLSRRFLPQLFSVDLPLAYRGIFLSEAITSPPGAVPRAYLFSAPTRAATPGSAVIRADLWDVVAGRPAAHAALRLTVAGNVWNGIADDQGRAAVQFPLPLLEKLSLGSPPGSGQGSIFGTTWPVVVQIPYQPSQLRFPLADLPDIAAPWNRLPSLKSILNEQGTAQIWTSESGPPVSATTATLRYGEELVLSTIFPQPSRLSGWLLISPGS
jgi:hypothetical protein